jgi:transglutaminase-like putative cysteine protease
MNILARYCIGYLEDISVRIDPNPRYFSGWAEVFLAGRWCSIGARHNHPRICRIVMGRGCEAADVATATFLLETRQESRRSRYEAPFAGDLTT